MILQVTNGNVGWLLRDRYGGIHYEFPPGVPVKIPREAGEHIFGWGLSEDERWKKFLRMGIANRPNGKEMWDNVKIRPVGNVEPTGAVREAA